MAVQYNDITRIGDVFEIHSQTPIIGIKSISGFIDVVLNETANRYFQREFRYSVNGIIYSEWQELSNDSLINTFVSGISIFDIQYRYTRVGTDDTGYLTFLSIQLLGVIEEQVNPKIFTDLYFNKFFNYNDDTVLRWALNVLEKLYKRGVIANYVEREVEGENDDDFLSFFGALTHFMAILVRYAREFQDFTLNDILLAEYLKQKGVFINDGMTLEDLQTMLSYFYNNFLERGTNQIVKRSGINGEIIDGELLRLIRKTSNDEFLLGIIETQLTIWNVNNNSPLYRGNKGAVNLIKAYEYTESVEDISLYPIIEGSYVSVYTDGLVDTLRILNVNPTSGTITSGIGNAIGLGKSIIIDSRISYEVSFYVKQAVLGDYLSLKVYLYDKDENLLLDSPISAVDGTQTNVSIDKQSLLQNGEFYLIRLVLFNEYIQYDVLNVLNIGFGNHLIINNSSAKFMSIELGSEIVSGGSWDNNNDLRIFDFKVRPLMTKVANGFTMIPNIINSFIENNSEESNVKIENKIKRFLLPYNSVLVNQFLDEKFVPTGTPLRITISYTNETILGAHNGTISIIATGGIKPYRYSIDNGSNFWYGNFFNGLYPATYDIIVEDTIGTQVTGTVVISQGVNNLDFTVFGTISSRLDIPDGSITVIANGGIAPYFYSRNGIDFFVSNVFTNLLSGNYTIYVRDTDTFQRSKTFFLDSVRNRTITLIVVNEKDEFIESVSVVVISENYSTNSIGRVIIYLSDGSYSFSLSKSGLRPVSLNSVAITEDRIIDVIMQTYYQLTFNVTDANSVGLPNVSIVSVVTPDTQDAFVISTPVGSGTVVKTDIIAGDYEFIFEKTNYVTRQIPKSLIVNDTLDVTLYLREYLFTTPGSFSWVCPVGFNQVLVECIGGGASGSGDEVPYSTTSGGGGSGGSYAASYITVTPGVTYNIQVAASVVGNTLYGINGNNSSFNSTMVLALGGKAATASSLGLGTIVGSIGSIRYRGGNGTAFKDLIVGGSGGGCAGRYGNGFDGQNIVFGGGNGNDGNGNVFGKGGDPAFIGFGYFNGRPGSNYGGGGGAAFPNSPGSFIGGVGAIGLVRITWSS